MAYLKNIKMKGEFSQSNSNSSYWYLWILFCVLPQFSFAQYANIGQQTLSYIDNERNRPVKIEVWYPTSEKDESGERRTPLPFVLKPTIRNAAIFEKNLPLVILSHGTGGNRLGLAWLAIALAEQGYIVAAPDHWGNTFDNKIPEYFVRYWERPLDVRFVIDILLNDESFSLIIDENRIGTAGFSLGGFTALAVAGAEIDCQLLQLSAQNKKYKKEVNVPELGDLRKLIDNLNCNSIPTQLKDTRVKAAVALAPALGMAFNDAQQIEKVDIPVLIIGMKNDQITPVATNAKHYHTLLPNSHYYEVAGSAGHYVMLNQANDNLKKEAKRYYVDDASINRAEVHQMVIMEIVQFFNTRL